jgi:histidine triad (HIT) family protein
MTIFSKIIAGEIPCYKIAENNQFIAFLDINPLAKGHTLVVTKQEEKYIFNLNDQLISQMTVFAKYVANAIEKTIPCERIGMAVIGLEVPHVHIHLIPITTQKDMSFENPRLKLTPEELRKITDNIKVNYQKAK